MKKTIFTKIKSIRRTYCITKNISVLIKEKKTIITEKDIQYFKRVSNHNNTILTSSNFSQLITLLLVRVNCIVPPQLFIFYIKDIELLILTKCTTNLKSIIIEDDR